jgi:type IV pilus assembly protein PilN
MIRINLLPIKQDRRREAGRNQIIIGLVVVAIEIVVFVFINMNLESKLEEQRNKNGIVKASVDRIIKQVKDHQSIINEIKEFEKRQAAIEGLQTARTGPVFVMLELSNLISKGGRPHIDNDRYQEMIQLDPSSGYDENWDFRRLWITGFTEQDKKIKLDGQALTHEDVAEFLRRVNLSEYFVSNRLVSTRVSNPSIDRSKLPKDATVEPVVHFSLTGEVKYR